MHPWASLRGSQGFGARALGLERALSPLNNAWDRAGPGAGVLSRRRRGLQGQAWLV